MILEEIKKQCNDLKEYTNNLIFDYKKIVSSLTELYTLISSSNSDLANRINNLKNEYIDLLRTVSENYILCADELLKYVDKSNNNYKLLSREIEKNSKRFSDILLKINDF